MSLTSLKKGIKPIAINIIDVDASIDQEALNEHTILQPTNSQLIYQPKHLILNSKKNDGFSSLILHVTFVADIDAPTGPAVNTFSVLQQVVHLNMTVQESQAMIVTPAISVVPYENENAFDETGLLGFEILLEIPGGTCTKDMHIEVSGHYDGVGEAVFQLCGVNLVKADPGVITQDMAASNYKVDVSTKSLGRVCAAALLHPTEKHQSILYHIIFHLATTANTTLNAEIRMNGRIRLGENALWSGGVAIRVQRGIGAPLHNGNCNTQEAFSISQGHKCPI